MLNLPHQAFCFMNSKFLNYGNALKRYVGWILLHVSGYCPPEWFFLLLKVWWNLIIDISEKICKGRLLSFLCHLNWMQYLQQRVINVASKESENAQLEIEIATYILSHFSSKFCLSRITPPIVLFQPFPKSSKRIPICSPLLNFIHRPILGRIIGCGVMPSSIC